MIKGFGVPGVPFRLPALQRALAPFFERKGMRWQTYGRLVHGWLVENRAPHTDWSRAAPATPAGRTGSRGTRPEKWGHSTLG